ncbi:hypothetical protein C7E12_23015, partial [Stenotrophomonas maltophilia]
RSLEHRQPAHARRAAWQGRHRQRPHHFPRLHRRGDAPAGRSLEHRQPAHARRAAWQGRHRQRPHHFPRLHR